MNILSWRSCRFASGLACLAILGGLAGCSSDDDDEEPCPVKVNNPQQIVIEDDYQSASGTDQYGWDTTATVARLQVKGHEFQNGSLRVRAVDAQGQEVLNTTYRTSDDFWYVAGSEFYDLRFSTAGTAGRWTIFLEFDEFTSNLQVSLVDSLNPPDSGGNPPLPHDPILDSTFGLNGVVRHTGDNSFGIDVALDSQGRVVTSGIIVDSVGNRRLAAWRCLPDGSFDPAFGSGGLYQHFAETQTIGTRLAIASGDAVLVTGFITEVTGGTDLIVIKINSSGDLDTSFGSGGTVSIDLGLNERGAGIALDSSGKICVAGTARSNDATTQKIVLARLLTNGLPDPGFGTLGQLVTAGPDDVCSDLIVDSLDRPTVLGRRQTGVLLLRTNGGGIPDGVFGGTGVVVQNPTLGTTWIPLSLARRASDGYLGIAGVETDDSADQLPKLAVWLFSVDGEPVTGFSADGFINVGYDSTKVGGAGVDFDPDGKLVVVGGTSSTTGDGAASIWRINQNGTVDTTLALKGFIRFDDPPGTSDRTMCMGMTLQPSTGRVFATGAYSMASGSVFMSTYKLQP